MAPPSSCHRFGSLHHVHSIIESSSDIRSPMNLIRRIGNSRKKNACTVAHPSMSEHIAFLLSSTRRKARIYGVRSSILPCKRGPSNNKTAVGLRALAWRARESPQTNRTPHVCCGCRALPSASLLQQAVRQCWQDSRRRTWVEFWAKHEDIGGVHLLGFRPCLDGVQRLAI